MTHHDKLACVRQGLGHAPTQREIQQWLWSGRRAGLSLPDQIALVVAGLGRSEEDWRVKVFGLIQQIPHGHLVSYRELAAWANRKHGLRINPRNVAWLRRRIYQTVGHDTDLPIHRIANAGDTTSEHDHKVTQAFNA